MITLLQITPTKDVTMWTDPEPITLADLWAELNLAEVLEAFGSLKDVHTKLLKVYHANLAHVACSCVNNLLSNLCVHRKNM